MRIPLVKLRMVAQLGLAQGIMRAVSAFRRADQPRKHTHTHIGYLQVNLKKKPRKDCSLQR